MRIKFWKPTSIDTGLLTDPDAQIEWMENGGWAVSLELKAWDGHPWKGKIYKFIKMYHSADWYISHESSGSLEQVIESLYLNARKSLPSEGMLSA